ncbi:hypothetical protein ACI68E_001538 [Malassezia pachydermatis]
MTIAGYIPGHLHNFFVQRIRDNSRREDRTPKWLRKLGVIEGHHGVAKNRKWADRYLRHYSRPVQYDEEGRAYYLDMDEEGQETVEPVPADALVEPDRYFNENRRRPDNASEYNTPYASTPSPMMQEPPSSRRGSSKTLRSRTMRFLGMGSGGNSQHGNGTYMPMQDRHSRANTYSNQEVHAGNNYLDDDQDEDEDERTDYQRYSSAQAMSNDAYDDLDRELMGLSTQENYPPVRTGPRKPVSRARNNGSHRAPPASRPEPSASRDLAPERDILDFDHTF